MKSPGTREVGRPERTNPDMDRIEKLLATMTLEEKLGQLTMTAAGMSVTGPVIAGDSSEAVRAGRIGSLFNLYGAEPVREMQRLAVEESRLGIPLLFALDVIHGHRTLFPIPLAEAGLFDPATWALSAREAACEAAADGLAMTFAPMLDISRDPRWGRTAEGPGEDPYVAGAFARAKVQGFQGAALEAADALAAVAKHYCAYGAVAAGRDYAPVDISERTLREVHLPAFEEAIRAGVAAVMPAFTDLAGVPMTAHAALLRGHLRARLGFEGVIVSDYHAIAELLRHGVAADLAEAAALALHAGVDVDMMSNAYRDGLPVALGRGLVALPAIDAAVRRMLRLKERLGLFEDPYRRGRIVPSEAEAARRRALAREIGARAVVLLRNARDVLPLSAATGRIGLIGPLADAGAQMGGPWWAAGDERRHVGVLQAMRQRFGAQRILQARGVPVEGADRGGIEEAVRLCAAVDVAVLCLGESALMSGEAASRAHPGLPGEQRALAEAVVAAARGRGIPVVAILFSGRPLDVAWLDEQADAVLAAWFPGSEAGNAVADVLSGDAAPCGRTAITWPRSTGQIPIHYAQRPGGRPADPGDKYTSKYLDSPNEPLYPFGHGLGYGRCTLEALRLSQAAASRGEVVQVEVDVSNGGARAMRETVFLFVRDKVASVARPVLELKGFGSIDLPPGGRGTVRLDLAVADLEFLGPDLAPVFEPGDVEILAGRSADPAGLLSATLSIGS